MPPEPVSRRDRPAKPLLSRDLIVTTALDLLAREGVESLSMRKVAALLDTGAASLYVYVQDREHLVSLMVDRVMDQIPLTTPAEGDWQERLIVMARNSLAAYAHYPGLASLSFGVIPTGENALRLAEHMVTLLRIPNLPDQSIAWAIDAIGLLITATAVEADIWAAGANRGQTTDVVLAGMDVVFRALPPARFPELVRLTPMLMQGDSAERFTWGLRALLQGIVIVGSSTTAG